MVGRGSDQDMRGMEEGGRNLRNGRWLRGRGQGTGQGKRKGGKKMGRAVLWCGRKLRGQDQGGAKNGFSRGQVGLVMGSGPEGKEAPWQVSNPVRADASGSQCVFKATMEALNHAIGLWMEGSCGDVSDVKEC